MTDTIAAQINALRRMTVKELREKYREVYGEDTRSGNKDWLWKRIAWRIQELQFGGLSERAKRRAEELANEANIRMKVPKDAFSDALKNVESGIRDGGPSSASRDSRLPAPGTVIERYYKGRSYSVKILDDGFEFAGRAYKSLTAVAREITGTHWNGFLFFQL